MPSDEAFPENLQHHQPIALLTALSGNAQLLRRQILCDDALSTLKRDMLLTTLVTMLQPTETLR